MLLWRSDRFRLSAGDCALDTLTKRGEHIHDGGICASRLLEYLDLPNTGVDVWLELHDREATDRLRLTARGTYMAIVRIEGQFWGWASVGQERLLRRLGLIGGKRKCLYLEVWYREVE